MQDNIHPPADCRHNRTLPQIHLNGLVVPGAALALGLVPDVGLDVAVAVVGDQGQKDHTGYPDPARQQAVWPNGNTARRPVGGSMWNVAVDPAEIEPEVVVGRNGGLGLAGAIVWTVGRGEWEAHAERIVVVAR